MTNHDSNKTHGKTEPSLRRSQRVVLSVAITVTGKGETGFSEETRTLVVNAHGALIALATKVEKGDTILVKHRATQEEQVCKVIYLGPKAEGKIQVGIEFRQPAPEFWHIQFPQET